MSLKEESDKKINTIAANLYPKILKNIMTIQINTDKSLTVHEMYHAQLKDLLSEELNRFDEHITRLEMHLSDENGNKESEDDKRCLLEARLKDRQPIAVSDVANTYDQAVNGAIDKLKTSLDTILGRLRNH